MFYLEKSHWDMRLACSSHCRECCWIKWIIMLTFMYLTDADPWYQDTKFPVQFTKSQPSIYGVELMAHSCHTTAFLLWHKLALVQIWIFSTQQYKTTHDIPIDWSLCQQNNTWTIRMGGYYPDLTTMEYRIPIDCECHANGRKFQTSLNELTTK